MGFVVVQIRAAPGAPARVVRRHGGVQIGRGPDNDLVLADPETSWRHALVYLDGSDLWIRDLDSRNGTLVDGEPIRHPTPLTSSSRIHIGGIELTVTAEPDTHGALLVEDLAAGVSHPIVGERFVIGSGEGANLRHPHLGEPVTLLLVGHGEVWAGRGGEDWPLTIGEPFAIDGVRFVLSKADAERVPTVESQGRLYDYRLRAALDRGPTPQALLEDPHTGAACRFTAETRAVLLYALGQQIVRDRAAEVGHADEGWVADPALVSAVWGRTPVADGRTRLKTLVHRVRHDCRSAGLDPWCLEKRSGHTRIRVDEVDIAGGP